MEVLDYIGILAGGGERRAGKRRRRRRAKGGVVLGPEGGGGEGGVCEGDLVDCVGGFVGFLRGVDIGVLAIGGGIRRVRGRLVGVVGEEGAAVGLFDYGGGEVGGGG